MDTEIFHFSATGNSLHLARRLAQRLDGSRQTSIPGALRQGAFRTHARRIGFVFPVYAWGVPRIVAEFVSRMEVVEVGYVFAVATCVAVPGRTLEELRELLAARGIVLDASFVVTAPRSSLMRLNALDRIVIALERGRDRYPGADARLDEIASTIQEGRGHGPETSSWLVDRFGALFHGLALNSFRTMDERFQVAGNCKGCGTCAKVCPRGNITLEGTRPTFHHDCEFCHACVQWCPSFVIRHPGFDPEPRQYRHPQVRVAEIARVHP